MQIERNSPIPLYEQVKNIIEQQIRSNVLLPDQQIPSERELCDTLGVSRITIRQAISLAEQEGLVYRIHGIGTFVNKEKIKQPLSKINSFQSSLSKQGLIASTKIVQIEDIPNNLHISKILNVDISQNVKKVQLLGYGNNSPIVFYDSYLSMDIGNKISKLAKLEFEKNNSFTTLDLYSQMEETPTHIEQTFEAICSTHELSKILDLEVGSPIFLITSILYISKNPIEYRKAFYRGDKYKFFITREYSLQ